ncbi:MAG: glutathione S-transferase family protein [Bdellovibrionota bacterium]
MKIYEDRMAPNPRRVRIFMAEKGIPIEYVQVQIAKGEHKLPEHIQKNPLGLVPVLEMDDGTYLSESVAICRYFEEQKPEPSLFGTNAKERAFIEMWQRRMEIELLFYMAGCFRNTHVFFKGRIPQVAEYGEVCRKAAEKRLEWLDKELEGREFIAGDKYSIADITALVAVDFGRISNIRITPEQKNLQRWHQTVAARPSAKA